MGDVRGGQATRRVRCVDGAGRLDAREGRWRGESERREPFPGQGNPEEPGDLGERHSCADGHADERHRRGELQFARVACVGTPSPPEGARGWVIDAKPCH